MPRTISLDQTFVAPLPHLAQASGLGLRISGVGGPLRGPETLLAASSASLRAARLEIEGVKGFFLPQVEQTFMDLAESSGQPEAACATIRVSEAKDSPAMPGSLQ
jgi:hypothetical protein